MTDIVDASMSEIRADKPRFLTQTRFDELNLPDTVLQGLTEAGFIHCSPIQAQTLPLSLSGKDVAGQAQTGTGKTAAFLVTVLTRLLADDARTPGHPSALIVSPTRELALQTFEEASLIGKYTGLAFAQVVGGVDYQKQADALKNGVDVVIGTPGRIIDFFKQGVFKTSAIRLIIIDEADRLLDMGFAKDMRFILQKLPRYDKRQTLLFSATLSFRVMELTYEYMNLPEFISVTPEEVAVDGIEQSLFHIGSDQKLSLLLGILERESWERVLIFVNTKSGVEWLTYKLKGNGWPAEGITGDLPQQKRFKLMEQFKEGKIKMLIATDVASRGIHVEDISHVINYDLPQDPENYIHRIGRTARAGKTGKAISFACEAYVFHLEPLEALLNQKIPVMWPEDGWFREDTAGSAPKGHYSSDRNKKPARKPRPQAPDRTERPVRTERPERTERRREAPSFNFMFERTENYFPGTFFGFGPQPVEDTYPPDMELDAPEMDDTRMPEENSVASPPATPETVQIAVPSETMAPEAPSAPGEVTPAKKKRRRRRYSKKKSAAPAPDADLSSDTPPENSVSE